MRKLSFFFVFLLFLTQSASQAADLAKINGKTITKEWFEKRYEENSKFFGFEKPSKKAVLEDVIKRELAIQEAQKMGLDKDPEIMDRMNTVLYHALIEKRLGKDFEKIHVEDADAKEYYEKNPEIRTSHIFVAVRPGATKEEEQKGFEKIKKLYDAHVKVGQMSFSEIAQRFSEGVAAPMGGDIDYQTKDKLDPKYYDAALKLGKPGNVSGIVRSQFGYHIIKLTAIRPWEETDKARIKRIVFEEKKKELFDKFMDQLRKQGAVSVSESLLKD